MAEYRLTLVDTAGIQEYIFGSNNLAQNIGASELVSLATRDWVFEELGDMPHNGIRRHSGPGWDMVDKSIATHGLDAEVVYAGGGNAVVLFSDKGKQAEFVKRLTRRVLKDAPGLEVVIESIPLEWEANDLAQKLGALRQVVGSKATRPPASVPLLGLGVTATCDYTALPVYGARRSPDGIEQAISRPVACKLDATERGKERLHALLPDDHQDYEFVYDFDQFGTPGESSYIAVIHADGNRMGERFRTLPASNNADYARALRTFSQSIQTAAQAALRYTVSTLIGAYENGPLGEQVPITDHRLPFRPIVFGGDDVTCVTDGRLGLTLAAIYLQTLMKLSSKLGDGQPLYSRAGVAIVKTHYPFSRAYQLAEDLAQAAKSAIQRQEDVALDWHYSTSGAIRELDEIRKQEYTSRQGHSLLMRPVRMGTVQEVGWQGWETFLRVTTAFKTDPNWAGRRNKVKALRDALRAGPEAVRQFITNYEIRGGLPAIGMEEMQKTGWQTGGCGYFDAIEAMDLFIDLEGSKQ